MQKDLYILTIYQGVEPIITGPFKNVEARQDALRAVKKEYGQESSHYKLDVPTGTQIEIGQF